MLTGFTHHGADGSIHDGPGGMFRCEQCGTEDIPEFRQDAVSEWIERTGIDPITGESR